MRDNWLKAYLSLAVILGLSAFLLRGASWNSSGKVQILFETGSTLMALTIGSIALLSYYGKQDKRLLFIGTAFLSAGLLDSYHLLLSSSSAALQAWSWNVSRTLLSVLLWLSWVIGRKQLRLGKIDQISARGLYVVVAFLTLTGFVILTIAPLPQHYYAQSILHQPQELVPAIFFLLAFIGYLRAGRWRYDSLEFGLLLSLVLAFSQALFMALSLQSFEELSGAAHQIKLLSYLLVFIGLSIKIYSTFIRLNTLHAVSLVGAQAKDEDELLARVSHIIGLRFSLDSGGIFLLDARAGVLRAHSSYQGLTHDEAAGVPLGKGIVGTVAAASESRRVDDVSQDTAYVDLSPDIRSELCVPLLADAQVIGVINIESRRRNAYSPADEHLLTELASHLVTALEKERLINSISRRRREAEVLQSAITVLASTVDFDMLMKYVLAFVERALPFDTAYIFFLEGEQLRVVGASDSRDSSEKMIGTRLPVDELYQEIRRSGQVLTRTDVQADERLRNWPGTEALHSWMGIPLIHFDNVFGLITLGSYSRSAYGAEEAVLAEVFASQAAVAIERSRLFEAQRRHGEQLETLQSLSAEIGSSLDLPVVMNASLQASLDLSSGASSANLYLYDEATNSFPQATGLQKSGVALQLDKQPPSDGPVATVALRRQPLVINDVSAHPLYGAHDWGFKALAGLPLKLSGRLLGVLTVAYERIHEFTAEELQLLEMLATQAAVAIQNASLHMSLQESKNRLNQITDVIEDLFFIADVKSLSVIYASPAYEKIWGRPLEDLYEDYKHWEEAIHPEDLVPLQESWKRMVERGDPFYEGEYRVIHTDGSTRWVRSRRYPIGDESGQVYRIVGVVQDITARKQQEEELRKSQALYGQAEQMGQLGHWEWDHINGRMISCSEQFARIYGMTVDETLVYFSNWESVTRLANPDDRVRYEQHRIDSVGQREGMDIEFRIITRSGAVRHLHLLSENVLDDQGSIITRLGTVQDITARKQQEEALQEYAAELQSLYHATEQLLTSTDLNKLAEQIVYQVTQTFSAAHCSLLLVDEATTGLQLLAQSGEIELELPAYLPLQGDGLTTAAASSGDVVYVPDVRLDARYLVGNSRTSSELVLPLVAGGRVLGVLNLEDPEPDAYDARSRRVMSTFAERAALSLQSAILFEQVETASRSWRHTFDAMSEVVLIHDADAAILRANGVAAQVFDQPIAEMLGQNFSWASGPTSNAEFRCECLESLAAETDSGAASFADTLQEITYKDRIYMLSTAPLYNDSGRLTSIVHTARDVTEARRIEQALVASQKLADLGTLAAGVAHEINSPLQVITGVSQSIINKLDTDEWSRDRLQKQLEMLRRNSWRVAEIVRSLLSYAHVDDKDDEIQLHDLNTIVGETLLLIEHQLLSWDNVTIVTDLAPELPPFPCDQNQITQILINLLTNARDAMPEGGEIVIRSYFEPPRPEVLLTQSSGELDTDDSSPQPDEIEEPGWIGLRVTDEGSGITPEVQARIFDPFFTTKKVGEGTGLGLSIVAGIVSAQGGEISLESELEVGTTFSLLFSMAGAKPDSSAGPTAPLLGRFDDTAPRQSVQNGTSTNRNQEVSHE